MHADAKHRHVALFTFPGYGHVHPMLRLAAERIAKTEPLGPPDKQERGVIINTASVAAFEGQSSSATLLQAVQSGNQVASATGQLVAAQQSALTNATQALLMRETTAADKEAATEAVVKAQDAAAVQSACQGVTASGVGMTLSWCNN